MKHLFAEIPVVAFANTVAPRSYTFVQLFNPANRLSLVSSFMTV